MGPGLFEECTSVQEVLGVLTGYASRCWVKKVKEEGKYGRPDTYETVFDSEAASRAVDEADERIKEILKADREKEFQPHPTPVGDYHDEDTLFKFHRALAKHHVEDVEAVTNTVLNDGLLIRERRPDPIAVSVKQ